MYNVEETGQTLCRTYIEERIEKADIPISDTIPRAGLYTFSNHPPVDTGKTTSPKYQVALATKMFMSLQARPESDMIDFFIHENDRCPPNISVKGKLYPGTKSDIIDCLPGMPKPGHCEEAKNVTALIYDMAAVIHMVSPKSANYFSEYPEKQMMPFFNSQLSQYKHCTRIDAVWDVYKRASPKTLRSDHRAVSSSRRNRIDDNIPIPKGK